MEISREQYDRIKDCLPRRRGNVRVGNLVWLNALLYAVEQGCQGRGLPRHFGRWHTIYTRLNRWSKKGVIERLFVRLQEEQILQVKLEALALDSTSIKVHPDGTGARKKTARSPLARAAEAGRPRFIWWPRLIGTL